MIVTLHVASCGQPDALAVRCPRATTVPSARASLVPRSCDTPTRGAGSEIYAAASRAAARARGTKQKSLTQNPRGAGRRGYGGRAGSTGPLGSLGGFNIGVGGQWAGVLAHVHCDPKFTAVIPP